MLNFLKERLKHYQINDYKCLNGSLFKGENGTEKPVSWFL
jgi:hypothetical protein